MLVRRPSAFRETNYTSPPGSPSAYYCMCLVTHRRRPRKAALTLRSPSFGQENPTNESIPAFPMLFESGGTTDLSTTALTIGVMRNGVAMFR